MLPAMSSKVNVPKDRNGLNTFFSILAMQPCSHIYKFKTWEPIILTNINELCMTIARYLLIESLL